jgi:hypothetical protein
MNRFVPDLVRPEQFPMRRIRLDRGIVRSSGEHCSISHDESSIRSLGVAGIGSTHGIKLLDSRAA